MILAPRVLRILSLGAGVQSSCLLRMSIAGVLPKLDAAIVADTQWEPPEVYAQIALLRAEAEAAGIPFYVVTAGNLRQHVIDRAGRATGSSSQPPMYARDQNRGDPKMIRRKCSRDFKIRPVERMSKQLAREAGLIVGRRLPKQVVVEQWLGISVDEITRMAHSVQPWQRFWHPLIEAEHGNPIRWRPDPLNREDCQRWMLERGFPPSPKSACIGCPMHDNTSWRAIRANPETWADAVDFDRRVRRLPGVKGDVFLHRSLRPLSEAPIDRHDAGQTAIDCGHGCRS